MEMAIKNARSAVVVYENSDGPSNRMTQPSIRFFVTIAIKGGRIMGLTDCVRTNYQRVGSLRVPEEVSSIKSQR